MCVLSSPPGHKSADDAPPPPPKAQAPPSAARELDAAKARAHVHKGEVFEFQGRWAGAEREYRHAMRLDPGHPRAAERHARAEAQVSAASPSRRRAFHHVAASSLLRLVISSSRLPLVVAETAVPRAGARGLVRIVALAAKRTVCVCVLCPRRRPAPRSWLC